MVAYPQQASDDAMQSTDHCPHPHSFLLLSSSCYEFKLTIIIFIRRISPNFAKRKMG
jgi:hypothetical protein